MTATAVQVLLQCPVMAPHLLPAVVQAALQVKTPVLSQAALPTTPPALPLAETQVQTNQIAHSVRVVVTTSRTADGMEVVSTAANCGKQVSTLVTIKPGSGSAGAAAKLMMALVAAATANTSAHSVALLCATEQIVACTRTAPEVAVVLLAQRQCGAISMELAERSLGCLLATSAMGETSPKAMPVARVAKQSFN